MFLSSVSGRTIFDAGATGVTANWSQTYSYDRYGNKLGATPSGVDQNSASIVADGLPSVSASTSTDRITTSGWEYDLTGNLIRGKDGTAWQKFEYDAAGRLVKIKNDSNTVLETYTYGASRERLMVETSSQRRYFAWGGQNVVAEYVETGSGTTPDYSKSYIYAGSRLFMTTTKASSTTETKEFHHPDRLGTQLVTEGSSGTSSRQSTMPFGTAISTETTGNTNQIFTSYDRSTTTGLDYAQNRTYSQGQSRFTQVDPIAMASTSHGNPQSNNLYAYVQNMPTDFLDPRGLEIVRVGNRVFLCVDGGDRWDPITATVYGAPCYDITYLFSGGGTVVTGIFDPSPGTSGGGTSQGPGPGIPSKRPAFLKECFDSRIATRVSDLNKERQLAMDTNILWALNPAALGPIQVKDLIPDEIKRNKNYAAVAGAIGIVNPYTGGPIGSGSSVLVQGAIEGTAGSANYRSALSKAKVVTSDDKEICEARADKLGIR